MGIIRYVNNPSKSPNYNYYADAINASSDGDTIQVYNNNQLVLTFIYRKPDNLVNDKKDLSDNLGKFLFTFINSSNSDINQVKNGKKLYLDYNSNKFKLANITNDNRSIVGENEFVGSKFNLKSDLSPNQNLLVGIGDNLLYDNKDLDNGFFIKLINSSNFNPSDTPNLNNPTEQNLVVEKFNETTNTNVTISIPTDKNDLTKQELIDKMYLYKSNDKFDKINLLKSDQTTYSIIKNNEKTFTIEIPSDGIIMFLDPGRYQEYAINQLSHSNMKNLTQYNIVNRAGFQLYNLGQSPKKGIFNGWKLDTTNQNYISYTLYNKKFDYDISTNQIEYFWVCIYQPDIQIQNINIDISGTTYTVSTEDIPGRYVFWYSSLFNTFENKEKFNLIDLTSNFIKIDGQNSKYISYININTIGNENKFYIESYGFSTFDKTFNFALTSICDDNIIDEQQLCLDNQAVYDLLINKIVQNDSCLPMSDSIIESNTISNGWYFDSNVNYNLKLFDNNDIDITYENLHTLFVEVIITSNKNFNINCFDQSIIINGSENDKKIIYFKNSPFSTESANTVEPPVSLMTGKIIARNGKYYQNIDAGKHSYVVTFFTEDGETTCSQRITTVTLNPGSGRVLLENIPVSSKSSVIGRKIYRTKANESNSEGLFYLLHTINDNTTTIFSDLIPDNLLGSKMPQINTTNKKFNLPYFSYLDSNITGILINGNELLETEILPEKKIGEFLLSIGNQTNIELISFGYKILGKEPVHLMTRWTSIESNLIVHNVDKFLTIQKDVINLTDESEIDYNSKFKVKAYGDFFSGEYKQYGDSYGDIRVNINVNVIAIKNALYILDSADISNFTIKIEGLKFTANGVSTINSNGIISQSSVLFNNKLKYIVPNYSVSANFEKTNYITLTNGQEIFYSNGGISSVLIQGVYAALFKEFNKSASILNNIILDSFGQVVLEVNKPNIPIISYFIDDATNLIPGAVYSYRITFFTSVGETESSIPSSDIVQPYGQAKKIKVDISKSVDSRVLGRKVYRKILGKQNNKYIYIATISNNTDEFYIDDIPEPTNLQVDPPSLVFLTNNESDYKDIDVSRLLNDTSSELTASSIYKYAFSYFTINNLEIQETELSESSIDTFIGANPYKIILNLPISSSPIVKGRFIYRTKANLSTFYLLAVVPNNKSTIFIDSISDQNLGTKNPVTISTLPEVTKPLLTTIGGYFFARPYVAQITQNFVTEGIYKYKFTYVISSSTGGQLGETAPSNESEPVKQPANKAVKILVNLPISSDPNVIKRNIYRTEASGNVFKFVTTIGDNKTSVFLDNVSDINLGRPAVDTNTTEIVAPEINTTVSSEGNTDPINYLISDIIKEENVPVANSKLFKLYVKSGRYAKDTSIYSNETNTVQMNLENMEINIRCRLRGIMYDITKNSSTIKYPLTKQVAELIFGKFNNPVGGIAGEPETLVREVKRVGNTTIGVDELGNKLDMLNNETNDDGSYKVISEIQYIIDFIICFVQKKN